MKILAVIPARGGSKRIPRKNLVELNGRPLIYYTIKAASGSRLLTKFLVSTDDEEIKETAEKYGAEVIMRPKELCEDTVPAHAALTHALEVEEKKGFIPDLVMSLQPTSPLKSSEDIDNAIELFMKHPEADSLFSFCENDHPPFWAFEIEDGMAAPIFGNDKLINSELLPKTYRPNGAIGLSSRTRFIKEKTFFLPKTLAFIMPRERSLDVDEKIDLKIVECLMKGDKVE